MLKILALATALVVPVACHADERPSQKPECPTRIYVDEDWQQPRWEDLTPDQVKKCMREYWKDQVDRGNQSLSNTQNDLGDAQRHLGMWQ